MRQKIIKITTALLVLVAVSSCVKEEINTVDSSSDQPYPVSLEDLKAGVDLIEDKTAGELQRTDPDSTMTWTDGNGSYFEIMGNRITRYSNYGDSTTDYSVTFEDNNFVYASNNENGDLVALPTWDSERLRFYLAYDHDLGRWIAATEVRYAVQHQEEVLTVQYSYIYPERARLRWYIDAFDDFDKYRYDIFLDDEKIEGNYTKTFIGQWYHINSLKEEASYTIKLVAKEENDKSRLRIKRFMLKTPQRIFISKFDITISEITQTDFKMSWTTPAATSSAPFSYSIRVSGGTGASVLTSTTANEIRINTLTHPNRFDTGGPFRVSIVAGVPSDKPDEPHYTEYRREYAEQFELLD